MVRQWVLKGRGFLGGNAGAAESGITSMQANTDVKKEDIREVESGN